MSEPTTSEQVSTVGAVAAEPMPYGEFLESIPPMQERLVTCSRKPQSTTLIMPEITLHCHHLKCSGARTFRCEDSQQALYQFGDYIHVHYSCSNCQCTDKTFALHVSPSTTYGKTVTFKVKKLGEEPSFGPATPARLLRLVQNDRELFLKGRRCENQGLGIGAFTYYRRVVENHKDSILDEIIRVANVNGLTVEAEKLKSAKAEIQFAKSIALTKDAIPQSIKINGQNPLTLLHTALSIGVHNLTDEECLNRAHDIRVVLVELSERIGTALKDEAELSAAISRLSKLSSGK
jgi:hypothetical protein